jgi:hypothetical protein
MLHSRLDPPNELLRYSMLRNSASGLYIGLPGRIQAGVLAGKHHNRVSGRPSAGRMAHCGAFPVAAKIPPGNSISRQEALLRNIDTKQINDFRS